MPASTRPRRPQMVLDLPGMVASGGLPGRQKRPWGQARTVPGVSLAPEKAAQERRAALSPLATATRGQVRESCGTAAWTHGVHIVRHMLPFWQAPVDDLLIMIEQVEAGSLLIYGEPGEPEEWMDS
jgi:hypothetical protein